MNYSIRFLPILLLLIPLNVYSLDLQHMLDKGPLITINRDNDDKFESITTYALVNAPLQCVWDTVLNIDDYARYMPRMVKSQILNKNDANTEMIVAFEIDTFMSNTKYQLKYMIDETRHTIDMYHHAGALQGSQWQWKFQRQGGNTLIICTGASKNISALIKAVDDGPQTLTVGINITSMLANLRYIKERSELLHGTNKKTESRDAISSQPNGH